MIATMICVHLLRILRMVPCFLRGQIGEEVLIAAGPPAGRYQDGQARTASAA
jgi:hypothetical protein